MLFRSGRINYWGQPSKIDWGFDDKKMMSKDQLAQIEKAQPRDPGARKKRESMLRTASACGPTEMHAAPPGSDFTTVS